MSDTNFDSEPAVYYELPKERQQALRKEFSEATKAGRNLIIFSVVIAAAMLAIAVCGFFVENWIFTGAVFPASFLPVMIAVNEGKFAEWLKTEKNTVMKRKK